MALETTAPRLNLAVTLDRRRPGYSTRSPDEAAIERSIVGREALLEGLVEAVVAALGSGQRRLHVLQGSRGLGKSHVLRVLELRLRAHRELRSRAVVIVPPSSRCPTSLVSLLAAVLGALPDDPALGPAADAVDSLRRWRDGDLEQRAVELIRARLRGQPMIVMLDDLDELLAALGADGQRRLGELLRREAGWVVVASARAALAMDEAALAELAVTFPLEHLTPEQCRELLIHLAEGHGQAALAELLATDEGADRVRAIHHMLGGDPRALVLLSRQLDVARLDRLELAIFDLAVSLEPRLRERMAQLSPGQRGVLEALAESWGPLTVTELAEQTFARQASVSGALRHLRREGLVRALELGRERYYELRDALHCFARPGRELVDCAAAIRRWYAGDRGTRPVVDRVGEGRPRPLGSEAEAEYEEARAILAQSPRIAVGRLRGRLASHRSPIMEAALVLGLERNEQASEAMDRLLTVASARARQTHEALVALAAKTLGDPLASPAARMVLRVLEADAEPGDPRAREALLQAFDGASAGRVGALSDMVLDYPMISRWLAAGADADLGALLLRLRPSRRSPSLELALEVAIASAWHRGRLPELLPASAALDGVLATASARTRELLAHASVVSILESGEPLDADELDAQLRRRLGRDPTESAWPTLAALAELDAARAALVLDLLHREVALQAWAGATGAIQPGDGTPLGPRRLSGEQREACEAVIAAGKYAWIASGRPLEPLAQLLRRVDGRARPDALLDAPGLREAYARLSAPERDLVRAILERRDDREALACLPAEN